MSYQIKKLFREIKNLPTLIKLEKKKLLALKRDKK